MSEGYNVEIWFFKADIIRQGKIKQKISGIFPGFFGQNSTGKKLRYNFFEFEEKIHKIILIPFLGYNTKIILL